MAAERHFYVGREPAYVKVFFCVIRKGHQKGRFREMIFQRHFLHGVVRQPFFKWHDGSGVSAENLAGEGVDLIYR